MKISYILPVYNVESYLRESVNSITCQTYKDTEIILVNDGSSDGSPSLCDQLAADDNRIKVLHKKNGGLSDARNAGLSISTGDYVIFMDSDDLWLGEDSLEKMVSFIKQNPSCQFYGFNCQYYYSDTNTYSKWVQYDKNVMVPISGSSAMISLVESGTFPMSACLKIIERRWLLDKRITFKYGQIAEDIPWFINLLDNCDKCIFVNEYIYAYRQNVAGSITASVGSRSFNSLMDIIKTELSLVEVRSFSSEAKDALLSFLAYELSILVASLNGLSKDKQVSARKELKSLCWLLKYTKNPKVRMVSIVYRIFGFSITERILRVYNWYRVNKKSWI